MSEDRIIRGDCLDVLASLPEKSVDLVIGSPPYENARTYSIGFNLVGQAWVDWMVEVYKAGLRVCKGLVAFVVEGKTRKFSYSGTPLLLGADLLRAGITLRKPPAFCRVGIPGSGGPDWWRNDYEFIICATNGGKLPWSDNTACGHPPKWGPGGEMSNRITDGTRVNQWGHCGRPSHKNAFGVMTDRAVGTRNYGNKDMERESYRARDARDGPYDPPVKANPGNLLRCIVGGGVMGSKLAHDNEAPFPESLVEKFVMSFCPPSGIVLDCFSGSGTTAAVATKKGRHFVAIDVRESQCELTRRRVAEALAVKQSG